MCFLVCLSVGLNVRTGDLSQTYGLNRTLTHYESIPSKGQTVLFVGEIYIQIIIHCMTIAGGIHGGL
ncbi:hypothetical protein GIB67_014651 [Kingdonia uniflora]|uniref:Uncharacterized protein n=1 Tax=Kingdonia uniflora TaxID=39325 RepID=A0A7J7LY46_9MAGN|nr:hypothetical protein GIB67_014651 [Kingdonia uniflora]